MVQLKLIRAHADMNLNLDLCVYLCCKWLLCLYCFAFIIHLVEARVLNWRVMTLGVVSHLFMVMLSLVVSFPLSPPQFSKIWRNILLSLSLPLSLICNCENKSNHLEMRKTIKRDGKLSQSTLWNSEVRKSGSTHDHRTHVHHWKHDMQIRCKIYVIFMHCTEIEKESEHWTIKQRYRHAHTFWFTNRVNGLICIISMKIQFELSLWV